MNPRFRAYDGEIEEFVYTFKNYDDVWFQFEHDGKLRAYVVHGMTSGTIHEPPQPSAVELFKPDMSTGLKDKNGNEIFENDRVVIERSTTSLQTGEIQFNDGCFDVVTPQTGFRDYLKVYVANHAIEIIGNKWEQENDLDKNEG